jgi:DNA polymerase-3 subunit gamma/tau
MVVGQATITNTLKSAIKNNKLAHAYLFCGPRGVGKTTCARIFAKTINCTNLTAEYEACDECESCRSFNSSRSFNIHELDAASNNKVEDIRSLNDQVRIPPQIGKYSIYIIDEVHMLTSSAFNAFLKTLEEPPAHAIFILATTEKHKIIPTILSRCQIFDFSRIKIEDIVKRLMFVASNEGITAEEEAMHVIAQKADGAMRDALSIFDQMTSLSGKSITYRDVIENLNVLDYEYYFRTVDAALLNDVSTALLIFNEVLEKGFDGQNFISGLNSHLRDLLVSKDEVTLRLLETTPALKQRYAAQSARASVDFLFNALGTGNECDLNYKNTKNPRLSVELALIKMCRSGNGTAEKKKPEQSLEDFAPAPAVKNETAQVKIETIQQSDNQIITNNADRNASSTRNLDIKNEHPVDHQPVISKPAKSFSIKDLLAGEEKPKSSTDPEKKEKVPETKNRSALTPAGFTDAWTEFTARLDGEGPRIVSMFKTMKPEFENENTVKIHLENAAQKDIFILNYKQRLINFLERKFVLNDFDIETIVDFSESNDILYTDDQKSSFLLNKYPVLREMKKTFNLDIQ